VLETKKKVITELKKAAAAAETIYLRPPTPTEKVRRSPGTSPRRSTAIRRSIVYCSTT